MIAPLCQHEERTKRGKDRRGNQRYRCKSCGRMFTDNAPRPLGDMRINLNQAGLIVSLLMEGMSIRGIERITGVHQDTIGALILQVGENCQRFMDSLEGLDVSDIQIDEIWAFVGAKEKNKTNMEQGDTWTYIAIERNTKMVVAFHVGLRNQHDCEQFLGKVNQATAGSKCQVSTDGLNVYRHGVPFAMGSRVDFGQLVKTYASSQTETRYSPATIIKSEKISRFGNPDQDKICTSHIERFNLTMRMTNRRMTRLTNAFSKSQDHHRCMQAIVFCYYNWCRKHETIQATPAMAQGIASEKWTVKRMIKEVAS